jgi:hypothetical protein
MSLKVLGATGAVWEITPFVAGSTFTTAPQHGQVISKGGTLFVIA